MRLIGLPEFTTIVFVILKLTGIIDWSWWWVFSPSLIAFTLSFVIGIIAMAVGAANGQSREEVMRKLMQFWMNE